MIAALYVQTNGAYYGIDGVDPWDEERDARLYDGPWPVVAHPPCNVWCALAPMAASQGHFKLGDDGGMFAHALGCVRKNGGVLEHPSNTYAWKEFGLLRPQGGGWTRSLYDDGWVCEVYQGNHGHLAAKPTWLYAVGCELPNLKWGESKENVGALTSLRNRNNRFAAKASKNSGLPVINKKEASATPKPFKQILIDMARSVKQRPNLQVVG